MITKIQKWGNSLGVRIAKDLAAPLNLRPGTPVKLTRTRRGLMVEPTRARPTLDELIKQITPQNRHQLSDWWQEVGREIW